MIFKNISNKYLTVFGKGTIGPGEEVNLPENFNNANFIKIKAELKTKKITIKKRKTKKK